MMLTAGVDAGSQAVKAVVYDTVQGCVLGRALQHTAAASAEAGEAVLAEALAQAKQPFAALSGIVGTGYGRISLPFADWRITEISCHARGAWTLCPRVRTVIDIGGQDSKVIRLDANGGVVDFEMNDRCAAGTGRFLEVMAQRLGTDLPGFVELALAAENPVVISSTCTVFAESEVVGLVARQCNTADIAAGLCLSVARRVSAMVERLGPQEPVALTGGVALNRAVAQALLACLATKIRVPSDPQFVGALGAAVLAGEKASVDA